MKNLSLKNYIIKKNYKKIFTPSPSFPIENLLGLSSNFSRGDEDFKKQFNSVVKKLKKISGQNKIVSIQGPGSLAIEIGLLNFLKGKILLVNTGYYSQRIKKILLDAKKNYKFLTKIDTINYQNIKNIKKKYDWICACYTETSIGFKIDIQELSKIAKIKQSRLFIDATASIGIEKYHNLADVVTFSSCKSLFGFTGACFVGYKKDPQNKINSFMLDINNHINKKMTGPNTTIQSLDFVLKNYSKFKKTVIMNKKNFMKKFSKFLIYPNKNQPNICTYINKKVRAGKNLIFYKPRVQNRGSIIFHLGSGHLNKNINKINNSIHTR